MTASPARRWTALLVFVAVPLVLLVLAGANVLEASDAMSRSEALDVQVARYRERLNTGAAESLDRRDYSPIFIEANSRSLAEADLQKRIVTAIEGASASVVETGASEVPESEGGDAIEIRATFDTNNGGLLRLLHGVETGLPLMFIEELATRRLDGDQAQGAKGEPRLRAELRVRAHWRSLTP